MMIYAIQKHLIAEQAEAALKFLANIDVHDAVESDPADGLRAGTLRNLIRVKTEAQKMGYATLYSDVAQYVEAESEICAL